VARANRHHIPGQIWHITHRCHKQEFLLKFVRDRKRWLQWLFETKKRYGLDILNYTVTSNHVHLLVVDLETDTQLRKSHRLWVEESMRHGGKTRQPEWTESIAVGSEGFVHGVLQRLAIRAKGRKVSEQDDHYILREPEMPYKGISTRANHQVRIDNEFFWRGSYT